MKRTYCVLAPEQEMLVAAIIDEIAAEYRLTRDFLLGCSKRRDIVEARFVAMAAIRDQLRLSYPDVGAIFNKDHGSVMHGCRQVVNYLSVDRSFKARWPKILKRIAAAHARVAGEREVA